MQHTTEGSDDLEPRMVAYSHTSLRERCRLVVFTSVAYLLSCLLSVAPVPLRSIPNWLHMLLALTYDLLLLICAGSHLLLLSRTRNIAQAKGSGLSEQQQRIPQQAYYLAYHMLTTLVWILAVGLLLLIVFLQYKYIYQFPELYNALPIAGKYCLLPAWYYLPDYRIANTYHRLA